jgi:uncharacterized membrane protein (DUF2068 family)
MAVASQPAPVKKRAPTLYAIIVFKLIKGSLFLFLALVAYSLSDNDLPQELRNVLEFLRINPDRQFFVKLAVSLGNLTEMKVVWAAVGTFVFSLFSLTEGIGLLFRVPWAGWLAIGESAFFVPLEVLELSHHFTLWLTAILITNVLIVVYLYANRARLFRHH